MIGIRRNIFEQGFLSNFTQESWNIKLPVNERLTTSDLKSIATAYGHISNLYTVLFEESNQLLQVGNHKVYTRDLANFTLLRYFKPPGQYWKSQGTMYTDTAACGGVPLALLGARNIQHKSYQSWLTDIDNIDDVKEAYKLDIFLGYSFKSITVNEDTGEKSWKKDRKGLIQYSNESALFTIPELLKLRSYTSNYAIKYTAKTADCEEDEVENVKFFNKASNTMRLLFYQGWCWYAKHRSSDMILCHYDWDKQPKSLDSASATLAGYDPKGNVLPPGIMALLGDTYENAAEFIKDHPYKSSTNNSDDELLLL